MVTADTRGGTVMAAKLLLRMMVCAVCLAAILRIIMPTVQTVIEQLQALQH